MKSQSADAWPHVAAARSRVLVIDNDSSMVLWVRSVLQAGGYDCLQAFSGEEALATLRATPDILVAISDIHMPGMDGISLLQSIGSLSGASVPRFIFLTAYPELEFAVAALRLGAVDFLVKPVRPQELLAAVRNAAERVDRNRVAMQLTDQAAMLAQQAEALAAALNAWKHQPQSEQPPRQADTTRGDLTLLGLDHLRRPRQAVAPLGELDDVAWDLLRELLRAEKAGQRISVSALSISVEHISPTTALRRIRELVKAGHIARNPDPLDARRDFVALAPDSRAALEHYLEQVTKELAAAVAPRP